MSTNVSKEKRERLIAEINEIKSYIASAPQDKNTAQLLAYIADIEKDIKGKKYGLVFEEHREKIDEILEQNTPVLTEEKDLFIDNGGQMNFLIEGDNLAALQLLEKTHKGKIDFIYIDPPYNTGNKDFVYDDNFVDRNDLFSHSKWLSFIRKRLELARKLMSAQGLIFISIDDNEFSQLKLLCDEVFSEDLFINLFVWQRNSSGKTEKDKFTVNTEYLLLYAKTASYNLNSTYKPLSDATKAMYSKDDNDGRGPYRLYPLQKPAAPGPETTYDYVDNTGKVWQCPAKGWRMKYSKLKALENDGRLCLENKSLSEKAYWNERKSDGKRIDTLWNDLPENSLGSKELTTILGKQSIFNNPKPTKLIERCITVGEKNGIILDFFAGSGTTGHAVMKLNAEDGGKRKFILCTNNENNICRDVTYERIKRVIERDKYEASLKYYKVDFVPISDKLYYEYADELLKHIRELVELENGVNFNGNAEIAIVLTEQELDEFTVNVPNECKVIYLGHDVLPSEAQESLFKAWGIAVNVIPDYYYRELEG